LKTDSFFEAGKIGSPHGIKGEIKVLIYSEDPSHLLSIATWWVGPTKEQISLFHVLQCRPFKKGVLVALKGIQSVEEARRLQGWKVWLSDENLKPTKDGEVYLKDLPGASLIDERGKNRGTVSAVNHTGSQYILEIKLHSGELLDIPFCRTYFGKFDEENRKLDIQHLDEYIEGMLSEEDQ
jgi:16S rRNA processing protein RimM